MLWQMLWSPGAPALASCSLLLHLPACSLGSRGVIKTIAQTERAWASHPRQKRGTALSWLAV